MRNFYVLITSIVFIVFLFACSSSGEKSSVNPEEIKHEGYLERAEVKKTVESNFETVQTCYEQGVEKDPELKGLFDVDFDLALNGTVTRVTIKKNELKDKKVEECMLNALKNWTFARPKRGTARVNYAFSFLPPLKENKEDKRKKVELDEFKVREIIQQNMAPIRNCYEIALQKNIKLKGSIELELLIDENGKLQQASTVKTTFKNQDIQNCIVVGVNSITFPIPAKPPVIARYNFEFDGPLNNPGSLNRKKLKEFLKSKDEEINECHLDALKTNSEIIGKLLIKVVVGTDGKVTDTFLLKSTVDSESVKNCVLEKIQNWTVFAPKGGPAKFEHQWVFKKPVKKEIKETKKSTKKAKKKKK